MNKILKLNRKNIFVVRNTLKTFSEKLNNSMNLNEYRNSLRKNFMKESNNNYVKSRKSEKTNFASNINKISKLTEDDGTINKLKNNYKNNSNSVNINDRKPKESGEIYSKDENNELLVPQRDLIPNIRARGIFERNPRDTNTP